MTVTFYDLYYEPSYDMYKRYVWISSAACNGIKNGRIADEGTPPAAKRSKPENSGSPIPREPFELAQLKSYGE